MSRIIFKTMTPTSPDKEQAEAIYNEAFPERERTFSFDELLNPEKNMESSKLTAAFEDGKTVGLLSYVEFDEYLYLMYFAISSELRGGGYGSKIMNFFLETFSEKTIIGIIETPVSGTSNYEQRVKRKIFWERLGIKATKYSCSMTNNDMYTLMASRQNDSIGGYFVSFFKPLQQTESKNGALSPGATYSPSRFYRTENGKMIEVPASEWLI